MLSGFRVVNSAIIYSNLEMVRKEISVASLKYYPGNAWKTSEKLRTSQSE